MFFPQGAVLSLTPFNIHTSYIPTPLYQSTIHTNALSGIKYLTTNRVLPVSTGLRSEIPN